MCRRNSTKAGTGEVGESTQADAPQINVGHTRRERLRESSERNTPRPRPSAPASSRQAEQRRAGWSLEPGALPAARGKGAAVM